MPNNPSFDNPLENELGNDPLTAGITADGSLELNDRPPEIGSEETIPTEEIPIVDETNEILSIDDDLPTGRETPETSNADPLIGEVTEEEDAEETTELDSLTNPEDREEAIASSDISDEVDDETDTPQKAIETAQTSDEIENGTEDTQTQPEDVEQSFEDTEDSDEDESPDAVESADTDNAELPPVELPEFDSGIFTVNGNGEIGVDFLHDGGKFKFELAIFSLEGMEEFWSDDDSTEFIAEAARRAASGSELGHVVISDTVEGAKFSGSLEGGKDWNAGNYAGVKTFQMRPGDTFAVMLVPNGKVSQVLVNPEVGGQKRPLFSLATANPDDGLHFGQIADVTGDGNTFVMEDMRIDGNSDFDYNDIIFQVRGAIGTAGLLDDAIDPAKDWRETDLGQALIEYAKPYITPDSPGGGESVDDGDTDLPDDSTDGAIDPPVDEGETPSEEVTDDGEEDTDSGDVTDEVTGESGESPTEDTQNTEDSSKDSVTDEVEESPIEDTDTTDDDSEDSIIDEVTGETEESSDSSSDETDLVDAPIVPEPFEFPAENQPNLIVIDGVEPPNVDPDVEATPEGTADTLTSEIIAGVNPVIGPQVEKATSENWTDILIESVNAIAKSGQTNGIVALNLNLTSVNEDGSITQRHNLTPEERAALTYARNHNVLIVIPAGETPQEISALGQAVLEFDNAISVGAAERVQDTVSTWKAYELAKNSGSGAALDILADGSYGDSINTLIATTKVAGVVSQVWAANPSLNYTQVIDILKRTATDLSQPNWDTVTGSGLINLSAAVHLATATQPEPYTVKPGARTVTDNFISQNPAEKSLPGIPAYPATEPPAIPETDIDTGANSIADAIELLPSPTQDIIDRVSPTDPTDIFQVDGRYLNGAELAVLSGELSVSYLTPTGQVLGTQVLDRGNHHLEPPDNLPEDVIVKIDSRGIKPANYVLYGFESTAPEPFDIALEFESPLTASQKQILELAAKSVASSIGQGLPTAIVDGKLIDDLNIKISTTALDGLGGTQARTKIDFMRYGTLLPAQSLVQFDAGDVAELEQSGKLFDVARHEFLHALGFGNLWEAKGLVDYPGTSLAQYNGRKAVEAFQNAGGLTDAIALETQGKGSAGLHWNKNLFGDELMSHDLNFGSDATGNAPLSQVTIASLADLGYEVNLDAATADYQIDGGIASLDVESLSEEGLEALRQFAEASFEDEVDQEYIAPIMPEVDPATVSPEIWAHAEQFWKNGEYYDWVPYQVQWGDTLSHIALQTMGSAHPDYYWWIANHNGILDPDYIVTGDWIEIPQHYPNYEWEQEQERLRREEELRNRQEQEQEHRREEEERLARDQAEQERKRQEEEARRREAERQQQELEEQERRLREEMERRRQEEERRKEEERLREAERQREIARQQGKGGQDWFFATPLPEFGPVDPFETKLTGETVGNLVPDDYYRFTLSRGGRVTAELKELLADADLVLYDARNRPIAYSMREGITDEQIIADLIPGTYMLRVNSPKGVTTDYELVVKFKHLLSRSEQGPPPGWRVGVPDSNGGSDVSGPVFGDPRLAQIYNTALNRFKAQEGEKANARIRELEVQKQGYEQDLQELLDQMNGEQRQKIHNALDAARHEGELWVEDIANPIKTQVDDLADGIIGKAESIYEDWKGKADKIRWFPSADYWRGKAKGFLRDGRDAIKGAVNQARSWLKGQINYIQEQVQSAIWHFFETIKNEYRTGAEINGIIENAAQSLKSKIDAAVRGANDLIGKFKGKVLSAVRWTENLGIDIDKLGVKVKFNVYNNLIDPAVNGVADGFQSVISGIGNKLKGAVDWVKPRAQKAVAFVVDAIFGDKTAALYNKINGVDRQIAETRTGLERSIDNQASLFKRLLDDFVNGLGNASNFVVGALMGEFNSEPSIWQTLLDTVIGMIPIVGEIGDVRDLIAYAKKFLDNPAEMKNAWNWIGVVGASLGLIPVVGGALKGVTKIARNADFVKEVRKLGPSIVDAIGNFARKADWTKLSAQSKKLFDRILSTTEGLLRKLNDGIHAFDDLLPRLGILQPQYVGIDRLPNGDFFSDIADTVQQLRRQAPEKIDEGFAFLKRKLDTVSPKLIEGSSTKLGKNLNFDKAFIPGTSIKYPGIRKDYQAHHVIPVEVANNSPLMLNAIQFGKFDIDEALNGIFLPNSEKNALKLYEETGIALPWHLGSHPQYSDKIQEAVTQEWQDLLQLGKTEDSEALQFSVKRIANWAKQGLVEGYLINDPTSKWF